MLERIVDGGVLAGIRPHAEGKVTLRVEIHAEHAETLVLQADRKGVGRRCFARPALLVDERDDFGHICTAFRRAPIRWALL